MHIPDAYLSPVTQVAGFAVMAPFWAIAIRKTSRELTKKQVPLLAMGAGFCFVVQMFNLPAPGGTTAHALGIALLTVLVGPWAALLGMTLTLAVQAILFGDGGILALGINCFNMALVVSFSAHAIIRGLAGSAAAGSPRHLVAVAMGAFGGSVLGALSAGIILGLQPLIASDALGHALYFPFGMSVSVPAMLISHLAVAGPAEAVVTLFAVAFLARNFPEYFRGGAERIGTKLRLSSVLTACFVFTPLGLMATGSAWGEWELDTLKQMVGYAPAGIANATELARPAMPDYAFHGADGNFLAILGYIFSAAVGATVVGSALRVALRQVKSPAASSQVPLAPSLALPAWLRTTNPVVVSGRAPSRWLQQTVAQVRRTYAKTIAFESIARAGHGASQLNPVAKAISFLGLLVAASVVRSPGILAAIAGMGLVSALSARVPLVGLLRRVLGSAAFFGLVLAIPVATAWVTPGVEAARLGEFALTWPGLERGGWLLARLATAILIASVWQSTTRWNDLLGSLARLGVPEIFITMAQMTYRFLFILLETLGDMTQAREARQISGYGARGSRAYAGAGSAILFAKSATTANEVQMAIEARGGMARSMHLRDSSWSWLDSAVVVISLSLLTLSIYGAVTNAF